MASFPNSVRNTMEWWPFSVRGLPQWEESFNQSPVYDLSQGEPDLGFEFDQTMSG